MCGLQRPESWTHFTDIETLVGTAHMLQDFFATQFQRQDQRIHSLKQRKEA